MVGLQKKVPKSSISTMPASVSLAMLFRNVSWD
jgi:hypothetical protein